MIARPRTIEPTQLKQEADTKARSRDDVVEKAAAFVRKGLSSLVPRLFDADPRDCYRVEQVISSRPPRKWTLGWSNLV